MITTKIIINKSDAIILKNALFRELTRATLEKESKKYVDKLENMIYQIALSQSEMDRGGNQ